MKNQDHVWMLTEWSCPPYPRTTQFVAVWKKKPCMTKLKAILEKFDHDEPITTEDAKTLRSTGKLDFFNGGFLLTLVKLS